MSEKVIESMVTKTISLRFSDFPTLKKIVVIKTARLTLLAICCMFWLYASVKIWLFQMMRAEIEPGMLIFASLLFGLFPLIGAVVICLQLRRLGKFYRISSGTIYEGTVDKLDYGRSRLSSTQTPHLSSITVEKRQFDIAPEFQRILANRAKPSHLVELLVIEFFGLVQIKYLGSGADSKIS